MTMFHFAASVLLLVAASAHVDGASDLPLPMTRRLLHGIGGALRLGVTGLEPLHGFEEYPTRRRFFSAWMSRVLGPFVPEKVEPHDRRYHDNTSTMSDANGIRWTMDTRTHFNITLPDETPDRLGVELGLNVSYTHVEVVLTRDVLDESRLNGLPSLDVVDAYIIVVANSTEVDQSRESFLRHDREVASHLLHATKWDSRQGYHCGYDVFKKAFDAFAQPRGSLASVSWSANALHVLDLIEFRSRKPVLYVVDVSSEEYIRQDPAFVASTEEWVRGSLVGEPRSPVIPTSVELEEELAQHNTSRGHNAASVFDAILGNVFRYFRLTHFYAIHGNSVRAWYIPVIWSNTPAYVAAGVVFHRPCTQCTYEERSWGCTFCTTHYDHFTRTVGEYLGAVDVGHASVLTGLTEATLAEKEFVTYDRYYRIQDGDVLKFKMSDNAVKEPEVQCVGYEDTRPRLLHPIGSELRICIAGMTNTGKTTLFNNMTCSDAEVSPKVFTTHRVISKTTEIPDNRFTWLANQFRTAMLRPSRVTISDTPALLVQYGSCMTPNPAPWMHEVYETLKHCDIIYLISKEFDNPSVELWKVDRNDPYACSELEGWDYEHSDWAVNMITREEDQKVLDAFRDSAALRNDTDELDALGTIEVNIGGKTLAESAKRLGFSHTLTDQRVRYHDWSKKELDVLERTRLLSAKPIVYVLNMNEEDSAKDSSSKFMEAQKYFDDYDKDALLLRFAGHRYSTRNASLSDVCELRGANAFLEKTLDHYRIAHFYTASEQFVAAWTFKLGTTFGEAAKLVNATFGPNVSVVEVANMREVIKAGSVENARSLGIFRRRTFDDEVADGDLLALTPGEPHEASGEITVSVSATTLASSGSAAPTSEEGRGTSYWVYVLLACILVLTMLLGAFRLLRDENLRTRVRTFVDTHFRRRGRRGEALLGEVSYEAESESISVR